VSRLDHGQITTANVSLQCRSPRRVARNVTSALTQRLRGRDHADFVTWDTAKQPPGTRNLGPDAQIRFMTRIFGQSGRTGSLIIDSCYGSRNRLWRRSVQCRISSAARRATLQPPRATSAPPSAKHPLANDFSTPRPAMSGLRTRWLVPRRRRASCGRHPAPRCAVHACRSPRPFKWTHIRRPRRGRNHEAKTTRR
jgi:hypothetical protein